eukprot:CAMPEP_0179951462 /NCGR_PEP_ID=MMETSP0983-20121128/23654_1 /TAXON_ID=483367 /ORGANISM="non described non described, Strain CCMP 2436" /LENGTH=42 /DNA_ID= /DNA_START= /DNA_END= /DNA_ORIENTATION=
MFMCSSLPSLDAAWNAEGTATAEPVARSPASRAGDGCRATRE